MFPCTPLRERDSKSSSLCSVDINGLGYRHGLPLTHQVTYTSFPFTPQEVYAGGQAIRMYLAPGEKLFAEARRDLAPTTGGFVSVDVQVYGYFVDVP